MASSVKIPLSARVPQAVRSREFAAVLSAVTLHAALVLPAALALPAVTPHLKSTELVPLVLLGEDVVLPNEAKTDPPALDEPPPIGSARAQKSLSRAQTPPDGEELFSRENSEVPVGDDPAAPEPFAHDPFGLDSPLSPLAGAESLGEGTSARGDGSGGTAHAGVSPARKPERQRAQLLASQGCDDLYPWNAPGEAQSVTVRLLVGASGGTQMEKVLSSTSPHRALVEAARVCSQRLRFAPAQNEEGRTIATQATVRLHFKRGDS